MDPQHYLDQTGRAVRHLFLGLNEYDAMALPSIVDYIDETGLVRMTKAENEAFLQAHQEFFGLEFARAMLCGSILQVAYMGVKQYSPATHASDGCLDFAIKHGTTAARFCRGQLVKGIPQGLLIYAGRIQYNHWEDGEPDNAVARSVLRALGRAYSDDPLFDMAYVLDYPAPRPISHYIVRLELGWRNYDDYMATMESLLGEA